MIYPRMRGSGNGGHVYTSDAVVTCFYMKKTHEEIVRRVVAAVEKLFTLIRAHRFVKYVDWEGNTRTLDDAAWQKLCEELLGDFHGMLQLHGVEQGANGFFVNYRGLPLPSPWPDREHDTSVLYIRLPTEYLEEHGPAHVRALALELAAGLPFNSGYVDLALCGSINRPSRDEVELVYERYLGVHLADRLGDFHVDTWVDGVHWLNFLGQPVLGKLGGVAALRERLAQPGISLQELEGERVLISLGEQPDPGDREAGATLPLHRALARILEPHLYQSQWYQHREEREAHRRWERRFLD